MDVNDDEVSLNKSSALKSIASELAPTQGYPQLFLSHGA
ncbi:hypothetical protein SAMN04490187_0912 [Pseudomonas jessenii]|jgi:hypothetical protein|uniref:Uncharacterized protein n=2 Tax=Pseudomonas TaxID=286 RepID=A0A1H4K998_PSEJE|nr:hypothetical protein SAMN04490187_0912 [Pseudomonas jessenii]VVP92772.1 hypothetical protein PS922_02884 [Pseudomonas fluorescens]